MKPLRNGRYDKWSYAQAHQFTLAFMLAMLALIAIIGVLLAGLRFSYLPTEMLNDSERLIMMCVCFLAVAPALFSLFPLMLYGGLWWEREYYLADFPKGGKSWWTIPIMFGLLGFPFLIVSYICLQRAKRRYRRADEKARQERETIWVGAKKAGKVNSEEQATIQENLRICAQNCWEEGLIWQNEGLASLIEQRRAEISDLEDQIEDLQELMACKLNELNELTNEQEYDPLDAKAGPELQQSMEQCLQTLCSLPEVAQVRADWYDQTMVREVQIRLHLADDPQDPQYDLGDYQLTLENDGANHYACRLGCTRSGMTAQGKALGSERNGATIISDSIFEHAVKSRLRAGLISEAVQVMASRIREAKLRDLEPEALGEYYLLLAPLRDR